MHFTSLVKWVDVKEATEGLRDGVTHPSLGWASPLKGSPPLTSGWVASAWPVAISGLLAMRTFIETAHIDTKSASHECMSGFSLFGIILHIPCSEPVHAFVARESDLRICDSSRGHHLSSIGVGRRAQLRLCDTSGGGVPCTLLLSAGRAEETGWPGEMGSGGDGDRTKRQQIVPIQRC